MYSIQQQIDIQAKAAIDLSRGVITKIEAMDKGLTQDKVEKIIYQRELRKGLTNDVQKH